mgnify:CR=1 FL=1
MNSSWLHLSRVAVAFSMFLLVVELAVLFAPNGPVPQTNDLIWAAEARMVEQGDACQVCVAAAEPVEDTSRGDACNQCVMGWGDVLGEIIGSDRHLPGWIFAISGVLLAFGGLRRATLMSADGTFWDFMLIPFLSLASYLVSVLYFFDMA